MVSKSALCWRMATSCAKGDGRGALHGGPAPWRVRGAGLGSVVEQTRLLVVCTWVEGPDQ